MQHSQASPLQTEDSTRSFRSILYQCQPGLMWPGRLADIGKSSLAGQLMSRLTWISLLPLLSAMVILSGRRESSLSKTSKWRGGSCVAEALLIRLFSRSGLEPVDVQTNWQPLIDHRYRQWHSLCLCSQITLISQYLIQFRHQSRHDPSLCFSRCNAGDGFQLTVRVFCEGNLVHFWRAFLVAATACALQ